MSRASSPLGNSGLPPPPPPQSNTTAQSVGNRESRRIAKLRNPSPVLLRLQVQAYVEPAIEEFCDPESDSDVAHTVINFNDANKMNRPSKRRAPVNGTQSSLPPAKKVRAAMTAEEEINYLLLKDDWEDTDQQDFDVNVSTSSKPDALVSTVDTHGTSRQPLAPKPITPANITSAANGQKQGKVDVIADKENIPPFNTADQLVQDGKKQGKANTVFNTTVIPPLIADWELAEGVRRESMDMWTRKLQQKRNLPVDHRLWRAAERALARSHLLREARELVPRFIQGENLKQYMSASKKVSYLDAHPKNRSKKLLEKREGLLTEMEAAKKDWDEQQIVLTKLTPWLAKIPTIEDARDAELERQQREKDEAARQQLPKPAVKKPATQKPVKQRKAAVSTCASTSTKRKRDDGNDDDEDNKRQTKQSKQSKERSDEPQRPKKAQAATRQPSKPAARQSAAKQPADNQTVKPRQSAIQQPSQLGVQPPPQLRQPAASKPLKRKHTSDVDDDRQEKRMKETITPANTKPAQQERPSVNSPRRVEKPKARTIDAFRDGLIPPHYMDVFNMGAMQRGDFDERKKAEKAADKAREEKNAREAEEYRIKNRKAARREFERGQRHRAQSPTEYKAQHGIAPAQIAPPPPPPPPSSPPSQSSNRREYGRSNDRGSGSRGSRDDRRQDQLNDGQREFHRDYRNVISRRYG